MELVHIEIRNILKKKIEKIFERKFENIDVQYSTKKKFGDFQTNFALINSEIIGKKPREIGKIIIKNLENDQKNDIIDKIEIAGPGFLNIFLKNSKIWQNLKKIGTEKYDFPIDTSKKVLIDYSSPNIGKRMHIGHLRSTIIGDSLKRIFEYIGFKVSGDNHLGDWGSRFGKLIIGYKKWLNAEEYEKNPIGEMERLYVKFSEEAQLNPELEVMAKEEWMKLKAGDENNRKLWQSFVDHSFREFEDFYRKMDVKFDYCIGESFYNEIIPETLKILEEKKISSDIDGELKVFFEKKDKLEPCVVKKKAENSYLYSTTDLATLKYRKDTLNIDRAVYVAVEKQKKHFRQVFRIAEMIGKPYDYEKNHVWFGIMRFEDGVVLSSKKRGMIRLIDIVNQAVEEAKIIIDIKNPTYSEEEKMKISEIVGLGAIKYFNLSQNRMSSICFSWDKILNFEGNTSPYLQYTYARIMSIFRKMNEENLEINNDYDAEYIELNNDFNENERELAVKLLKFPNSVLKAYELCKPNLIADYLFETAKIFNSFYAGESILREEDKKKFNTRLLLAEKTATILKEGLSLLGIKVIEKM